MVEPFIIDCSSASYRILITFCVDCRICRANGGAEVLYCGGKHGCNSIFVHRLKISNTNIHNFIDLIGYPTALFQECDKFDAIYTCHIRGVYRATVCSTKAHEGLRCLTFSSSIESRHWKKLFWETRKWHQWGFHRKILLNDQITTHFGRYTFPPGGVSHILGYVYTLSKSFWKLHQSWLKDRATLHKNWEECEWKKIWKVENLKVSLPFAPTL